jgi:hypothetical protein
LRSLCEPLRSQWNLGLPSAQGEGLSSVLALEVAIRADEADGHGFLAWLQELMHGVQSEIEVFDFIVFGKVDFHQRNAG